MAKFYGVIGYGKPTKTAPGVTEDVITEHPAFGDVLRHSVGFNEGTKVNDDISVSNSISIMADEYAFSHITEVRFLEWLGVCWKVTGYQLARPRIILSLGGVYNGPRSERSETPSPA